jgi:hypothetical protein
VSDSQWGALNDPEQLVDVLGKQADKRKLRLFAVACCRRAWKWFEHDDSQRAIELAEAYADRSIPRKELIQAQAAAKVHIRDSDSTAAAFAAAAVSLPTFRAKWVAYLARAVVRQNTYYSHPSWKPANADEPRHQDESLCQAMIIRDIFGNPSRPVAFDPSWRTSIAVGLARTMYESRDFAAMPILADALEEAGCDSPAVLAHCRDPNGVHVRGCWVVDLVLGKS